MPDFPTRRIKSGLVAFARDLGFDACRVTSADPPSHADAFRVWLDLGFHAEMDWMRRNADRRCNPALVLPGARSVVVLAMNYFQGGQPGPIARYAWGDDYHALVEKKLRALDTWLAGHGGSQRVYVDTGPVLERDLADRAGIGWTGKSTMLLDRHLGTWFFLAAILTTLPLDPDQPATHHCGSCTRCITACPTGAIVAPYRLDARRCISYLTIENKGIIPEIFRRAIGGRIYGCDACLEACPWNRFAHASSEASFAARESVASMLLRDFLSLDDHAFRSLFAKSPIKRIKRPRFLRNVCIALGNTGTADDLPALQRAAFDPDPLISEHAAWAIREITGRTPPPIPTPSAP